MKKAFFIVFLTVMALMLVSGTSYAVTGTCVNCHTMHNSQNGAAIVAAGAQPTLLRYAGGCAGCHAQGLGVNIVVAGNIPQVLHSNTTDLAGGNFAYLTGLKTPLTTGTVLTAGHNVNIAISAVPLDTTLTTPPGDENTTGVTNANLTCSGTKGCHGNRANDSAIAAHHTNAGGQLTTATTAGNSYRFLKGVQGYEDSDWHATVSSSLHNEYKAGTVGGTESTISTPGTGASISGLCGECHGNYHGSADTNAASPFIRHPVDLVIPNSGEYAAMSVTYNLTVPVGRTTIAASSSGTVAAGTDAVTCLSCHMAHASANADILRWNYSTISAGGSSDTTRCFVCHTLKDTGG